MYTLEEKYQLIYDNIIDEKSKNPLVILEKIMDLDFINIHGPEHHYLDAASFLVAFKNCGGDIEITSALEELKNRTIKMPGAMCGLWGVCGSVTAIGAALSIIDKTSPLSSDVHYKEHMEFTSKVINYMSSIGGPRCCKRNAFTSIKFAVKYVKEKYDLDMEINDKIICHYSHLNKDCIKNKCPYHINNK